MDQGWSPPRRFFSASRAAKWRGPSSPTFTVREFGARLARIGIDAEDQEFGGERAEIDLCRQPEGSGGSSSTETSISRPSGACSPAVGMNRISTVSSMALPLAPGSPRRSGRPGPAHARRHGLWTPAGSDRTPPTGSADRAPSKAPATNSSTCARVAAGASISTCMPWSGIFSTATGTLQGPPLGAFFGDVPEWLPALSIVVTLYFQSIGSRPGPGNANRRPPGLAGL